MGADLTIYHWPYVEYPEMWPQYDHDRDYCGPASRWYSKYLSRYIAGIDCNRCYWAHDQRYNIGSPWYSRRKADKAMLKDQLLCIRANTGGERFRRWYGCGVAWKRYVAVRLGGRKFFNKSGPVPAGKEG